MNETLLTIGILAACIAANPASAQGQQGQQDRSRDRTHQPDMDRVQDRDRIYASELLTPQERTQYMNQLRALRTEQERVQFRLDHQQQMQQRAKEQNAKLGRAPALKQLETQERDRQRERTQIFGYELMDQAELDRYREQVRSAKTQEERTRIQSEHRAEMQDRARERGVSLATDTN